jgi:hypothetical protein
MNCWYKGTRGGAEASGIVEKTAAAAIERSEKRVKVRIKFSE